MHLHSSGGFIQIELFEYYSFNRIFELLYLNNTTWQMQMHETLFCGL